ncbi:MAG: WYL domain-containing protein, partial [Lachnospiraceae bacterium]|nr:WYL domain-containing protein [Lachnospiraceae bacterium]
SFAKTGGAGKADVNPEFEKIIREAITTHTKVKMTYKAFGAKEPTERIFCPYECVMQEGNLSVMGYCELRGSIREFRLSRIISLSALPDTFSVDPEYEMRGERFISLMGKQREEIRLLFSKEIADFIKEYESGRAEKMVTNPDGTLEFIVKAAVTEDLVRWVLSYTGDVKVLAPSELKTRIKEKLDKGRMQSVE